MLFGLFGNNNPQPVRTPAPKPTAGPAPVRTAPQPQPSLFSRAVHDVTHNPVTNVVGNDVVKPVTNFVRPAADFAGGLASGAYHTAAIPVEAVRSAVATATHNQAADQAAQNRARQGFSFIRSVGQAIPQMGVQLEESLNPGSQGSGPRRNDVYQRSFTPTTNLEKFLLGDKPINSMQKQYKETKQQSGGARAAGEATLTAILDAAGGRGGFKGGAKVIKSGEKSAPAPVAETPKAPVPTPKLSTKPIEHTNPAVDATTAKPTTQPVAITETPKAQAAPTAPVKEPVLAPEPAGTKASRMANVTVQNSPKVNDLTKMLTLSHDVRYNPATVAEGQAAAKAAYGSMDLNKATLEVSQKLNGTENGKISRQDVFNAHEVADRLQKEGSPESLAQASDIYSKLSEHHTAAGQLNQAAAALVKQSPAGMLYSATKTLQKAGVELTDEKLKALQDHIDAVKNAKTQDEKIMNYDKLVQHVNQQIPRSKVAAGLGIWRAGLLSGPETAAKVAVSHLITAPLELTTRPVATAIDKVTGLVTGKRTMTMGKSDAPNFVKGEVKGLKAMGTKFKTNVDVPGTGGFETKMGGGTKETRYERFFASKIHGNLFKPNYSGAYRLELGNQARLAAKDAGLKGDQAKEFIDNFMQNPTDEAKSAANLYAEKFTNMNKTELGKFGSAVQGFNPGGLPVGKWLVPFSRIPTAIATKGIVDLTPLGIVKGVTKATIDGIQHGTFDQRAFSETIGKSLVGSTATTAVGFKLMENGRMTLQEPNDPKEKALWLAEGRQRNSVYVGGTVTKDSAGNFHYNGGKWVSLNAAGPAGIAMGLGGAFHNALQQHGDPVNATIDAMASAGKLVMDQPYFKGISGASNALNNPKQYAQSYISSLEGSLIPAGSQQIARGSDTKARTAPTDIKQNLGQGIPGVREKVLPAQKDLYGNDVPSNNGGSLPKDIVGAVNPFYPSPSRNGSDAPTQELQRLYGSLGASDAPAISQPQKSMKINGNNVKLTNDQLQQYIGIAGPLIHQGVSNLLQNSDYQGLTDLQKKDEINKVIDAAHTTAKIQLLGDNPKTLSDQTKLAMNDPGRLGTQISVPGLHLASGLSPEYSSLLTKVGRMTSEDKTNYLNDPKNKYQYDLATFQNDWMGGKYDNKPVDAFSKQQELAKENITSNFSSQVSSLYGKSQTEIKDFLDNYQGADKASLTTQLTKLDQQLYESGLISKLKFANGVGSSGSGGSGSGSGNKSFTPVSVSALSKLDSIFKESQKGISTPKLAVKAPKLGTRGFKSSSRSFKIKAPRVASGGVKPPKLLRPTSASFSKSKGTMKLTV